MTYLDRLKLADRPANPKDRIVFIEQRILPTLELCKRLEGDKLIVAGGPLSGAIALSLMVTPLTFEVRMQAVQARLDPMKTQAGAR